MPVYSRTKMCGECPFRANSVPGWLGPHSIEDIETYIQSDSIFICHETIVAMKRRGCSAKKIEDEGQHCVGFMRHMSAHCKLSRDFERAGFQARLKDIPDTPVLKRGMFRTYHELGKKGG
jgi:hypothetical protein